MKSFALVLFALAVAPFAHADEAVDTKIYNTLEAQVIAGNKAVKSYYSGGPSSWLLFKEIELTGGKLTCKRRSDEGHVISTVCSIERAE